MRYQVSIILVSYNPSKEKILHTVERILDQEGVTYEIIICDDCSSRDDCLEDVEYLLKERQFEDYKVLKNKSNIGTVKNLYGGILVSRGEYVFMASPGDHFYDNATLKKIYNFAVERKAQVCYGDVIPYSVDRGNIRVLGNAETCLRNNKVFDEDVSLYEQCFSVVTGNFPLGACVLRRRDYALKYTKMLCSCSKFSEDISIWASSLDGIRVYHYHNYVVWYEYGTGQSSSSNIEGNKRLLADVRNTLYYLKKCYPESEILDFRMISDNTKGLMRALKLFWHYPKLYLLKKKLNYGDKCRKNMYEIELSKF